ncbi:hypothetical protein VTN02DRAFT_2533 [Thermoascus thermophilus]
MMPKGNLILSFILISAKSGATVWKGYDGQQNATLSIYHVANARPSQPVYRQSKQILPRPARYLMSIPINGLLYHSLPPLHETDPSLSTPQGNRRIIIRLGVSRAAPSITLLRNDGTRTEAGIESATSRCTIRISGARACHELSTRSVADEAGIRASCGRAPVGVAASEAGDAALKTWLNTR